MTVTTAQPPALSAPTATSRARDLRGSDPRGSDYARLSRQVLEAGLLRRRPGYYAVKITLTLALLGVGWVGFGLLGRSWYQLLIAAFMAIAFTQVAFLGHDAGHRQVFRSRRANDALGLIHGNLLVGFSFGWWVAKHNRHHAHPNTVGKDPDIGDGALAFTATQADARTSVLGKALARRQAWAFFPLLLLEGLNLHVASARALIGGSRHHPSRPMEVGLLLTHAGLYLAVLFVFLSPGQALAFLAVQQVLFGLYLGASFAPNHKGMPILAADDRSGYLHRQVLTSRNVRGGPITDFALGGLNYQIEHHLFPSMPRPNLRRAQVLIRDYCEDRGISYREDTLLASYGMTLRHLNGVVGPRPEPR